MINEDDLTWDLPELVEYFNEGRDKVNSGTSGEAVFQSIRTTVATALLAAGPSFEKGFKQVDENFSCEGCYQLLGVDVMLDSNLQPFVIGMDGSPSMKM